jgi:very-short-patch-repair endonuclease
VDVAEVLRELGGVATRATLLRATDRRAVDHALATGAVVALARGRYALPEVDASVAAAHALSGVLCLTSAALHHGWAVKTVPEQPHIAVPRNRKVALDRRHGVRLHFLNLPAEDIVDDVATDKVTTLVQCFRQLPFDEALAIADSALRAGDEAAVRRAAAVARGPGSPRVREVASLARPEAANPFESALRAIAKDVRGLRVEPQVLITSTDPWCRPDLVDRELRVVIEADSFEWHGGRAALARDARRYNLLVADGWLVLRFAWEDVMYDPGYVRAVLEAVVARRAQVLPDRPGAA